MLTPSAAEAAGPRLCELDALCFGPDAAWCVEQFLADLPAKWQLSHVACEGEQVVGFVVASTYAAHAAHINRLAVSPTYRRCGVGRELVRHVEAAARNTDADVLTLEFDRELRADAFYAGLGFERLPEEFTAGYLRLKGKEHVRDLYSPLASARRKVFVKAVGRSSAAFQLFASSPSCTSP